MAELKRGAAAIGGFGLICGGLYALMIYIILQTEGVVSNMEKVRISLTALVSALVSTASILLLAAVRYNIQFLVSIWHGLAGSTMLCLAFLTTWNVYYEFPCLYAIIDLIFGGVIVFCAYVLYNYYLEMDYVEQEREATL